MYHLIIADDEEKICEGIARLFPWEQIGFQVKAEMHSGQEILDFLKKKETRVDVILCDIQMPGIDGLEVCRQASRLSNARIVLFSSHQNYEYFRKAIQYHAVDYLLKPIGYEDLVACFGKIREELDRDLRQGRVLTLEEGGAITGLLHFSLVGNTGEIRHLAVRSDLRGTGRTRPLLDGYLRAIGGVKSVVWTRSDDLAAQTAYQRRGFVPDGRRSVVLCYPEKEGMKP